MITREDGFVALQHRTSNPATAQVGDVIYSWVPKYNISIAWVHPSHVNPLLQVQAKLCCGKTGNKFFLASQINVNLWNTGNRYGTVS